MNLFLSYSTQDHHYKDEIKKTLSKLERDGKIKLWVDEKELKAGATFQDCIFKNSHFLTNESINTEDIEFIHSIIKTKDTYEILNGYRIDMFESNIG